MAISVVINTYNAERHLINVLEAVKDFDEVLICDMHSSDDTLKIAGKYDCKIIYHEKINYVEPARNFAIQHAKNDWVLVVDADEIVSEDLKMFLYNFIRNNSNYDAIAIPRKNYFLGKFMRSAYPDYCIRFFKKDSVKFSDKIHTPPEIKGDIFYIEQKKRNLAFEHLADESVFEITDKNNRYSNEELTKRKNKKIGFGKLLFSQFFWFFKYYILKKGILDGKAGFLFASLKSQYKFLTLAKIYENQIKK